MATSGYVRLSEQEYMGSGAFARRAVGSTTDPDARLIRRGRGKEAKLYHMGHLLIENQSGLLVDAKLDDGHR